jgi:DNA gyrase subunit A
VALITDSGRLVRTEVSEISQLGRNTQGVRLIGLSEGEALAGIERIDESMHLVVDDVDGLELDSKVNGDPV